MKDIMLFCMVFGITFRYIMSASRRLSFALARVFGFRFCMVGEPGFALSSLFLPLEKQGHLGKDPSSYAVA